MSYYLYLIDIMRLMRWHSLQMLSLFQACSICLEREVQDVVVWCQSERDPFSPANIDARPIRSTGMVSLRLDRKHSGTSLPIA